VNIAVHLSSNMLLNQMCYEDGDQYKLLRHSFYQFQADQDTWNQDTVKIAVDGLESYREVKYDLIIINTSGRHKQEVALFVEMRQVAEAMNPGLVIFVMDGSIGLVAFDRRPIALWRWPPEKGMLLPRIFYSWG